MATTEMAAYCFDALIYELNGLPAPEARGFNPLEELCVVRL